MAAALAGARPGPLLLAALLIVAPLALRSARALLLFRRCGYRAVPPGRMAAVTAFGFSLSSVTPGGSGDLLRIAVLRPYGVAGRDAAAVVVYERLIDVAVMLASLVLALLVTRAPPLWAALGIAAGVLALLGLGWVGWRRPFSLPGVDRLRHLAPTPATRDALSAPGTLVRAALLTGGVFALEALRPWLVAGALGLAIGAPAAWAVFVLAHLAGLASLLPLGVGSWDAAAVWAFGLYGVDPSTGAAGALLLRLCTTLPALLLGAVAALRLRSAPPGRAR